jgi:hypothetical protein
MKMVKLYERYVGAECILTIWLDNNAIVEIMRIGPDMDKYISHESMFISSCNNPKTYAALIKLASAIEDDNKDNQT